MEGLRQDMPPVGGFKSIVFERVPLKKYWPASVKWILFVATSAVGVYLYKQDKRRIAYETIEKRSARLSITPLLLAESDRMRLRHCRRLRDTEAELMKDVEGWKVGTYLGEPIYKTLGPDEWYDPTPVEYFIHSDPKYFDFSSRLYLKI